MNKTFEIETLGCKVNEYESAYYAEQLEKAGFRKVQPGETADVLVINTCTVTNTAAAKSRRKIHRVKRENPQAVTAAVGCYVQVSSKEEREELGVDVLIGAAHKDQLAQILLETMRQKEEQANENYSAGPDAETAFSSRDGVEDLVESSRDLTRFESMPIGHFEGQHRAFLKIQDGCNQYCAYCQIPLARGPERSQIPEEVVKSAVSLAKSGHKEIVLTGIHTGRYRFRQTDLSQLLKRLLENTPEDVCYRISSIEITEVSDALLDLMAENARILPHLHIPIQAGDNRTLARMKRPYTVEDFEKRLEEIRARIPHISISTDVICGFVQESDDEFATTVKTLEDCRFSFLHVFPYSRRKGTAADAMTGFIRGDIAKARTDQLLELSARLREKDMDRFDEAQVLVERADANDPNRYLGYTSQYHPIQILSEKPLNGRVNVKMTEIQDGHYLAVLKEE